MTKKHHIIYLSIKLVIFTILAVLILIFREKQVEFLKPHIGSLMFLYGVEGMLYEFLFHRKHFFHENKVYLALIEIIFGIVIIASPLPFETVCVVWATWSIIRESHEIKEIVADFKTITPRILSGVESVVVIVFSVMLIIEPGEHHAIIHMCLLFAELILNPLVVLIDEFLIDWKEKRKQKQIESK